MRISESLYVQLLWQFILMQIQNLLKRIQERGRPGEERITLDYLQGIQKHILSGEKP